MLKYVCIDSSRPKGSYMKNDKNKKRNSPKVCNRHPSVEEGRLAERERRLKDLEQLTLLSDVFMSVALSDLKACQHVVRILTGKPEITLVSVKTQYVISKITSHGARLYGALTDGEILRKGKDYSELPERYLFYISRKDIWKGGCTVYEAEKYFRQTGQPYMDGAHLIYVNAEIDDKSRTAKLMQYFRTADPFDDSEGELSKRVRFLKTEEGGIEIMCEIMERIREEGKQSGRLESSRKTAVNLGQMGMPPETIARAVEEDVTVVKQWLKATKK